MEKSTSAATPPPPSATSSLPLPTAAAADQRSSPAMDLDNPPVPSRPHIGGAQVAPSDPSSRGRKRGLEGNLKVENSNYYKMRLLVKDLRPHVLEVLRAPDFRNCKAAVEIQEKMKLLLQLYQEMIGQTPKLEKSTKTESLSNGKAFSQTPEATSTTDNKHNNSVVGDDKVVGGSAFGWNFVTYGGTDAVYCGLSKEEYRASHPIVQAEAHVEAQLFNIV
ncbi:uncharacterized protein BNACNNG08850D isoform X1 [Brassica napus]|uniref:uncharacterized protein BNACNNG08850D isoform X1 n=2 Tax=Brassica napus TaxID=3708 RepID=UPI00207A6594|nr:uncharacterized protein BNACNNG08850D isoform X1 [Brassica napus]